MDKMSQAKSRLLIKHPFFATLLLNTPLVESRSLPTAATDMKKIYYNPEFFSQLSVSQIMFVLAHEVMHIAFEHGLRLYGRNHQKWNFATDYAINYLLKEEGFEFVDGVLYERKYGGKSSEHIYDELPDPPEPPQGGGGQCEGDEGDGGQDNPGSGSSGNPQNPDGPGGTMSGDVLRPDGANDPGEVAKIRRQIKQKVAQAATNARLAGKMAGELERAVNEILDPKVPWEDLLREYMTRIVHDDVSWQKRNRRFRNVYLPARHSEGMGRIGFIVDTSGSVSDKEIAQVAAELTDIATNMQPEGILVVWADTQVAGEQEYEVGDELKPMGGGGTDMRVPLEHMEQHDDLEVVVMITDGYTPWPDVEPPYPLIVVCTTETEVPIGAVVRMD